jgi:hypothetical protein
MASKFYQEQNPLQSNPAPQSYKSGSGETRDFLLNLDPVIDARLDY